MTGERSLHRKGKLDEALSLGGTRFQELDPDFERFRFKNLMTGAKLFIRREWKMNRSKQS
jgi:hypothetical protein